MNVTGLFLLAVMTSALAAPQYVDWMRIEPRDDVKTSFYPYDEVWTAYKREYGKDYQSIDEEEMHFNIFLDNVREIEKHNANYVKGMESYYMGINLFTDMTDEEKKSRGCLLWDDKSKRSSINTTFLAPNNLELPDEVDWRKQGYVTPVKNQGACGSCWAFSTTGALEGQHFKKTGRLESLSEQQLVDCSKENHGCQGGNPPRALDYIKQNGGLEGESDYPYQGKAGQCQFKASKVKATVTGSVRLPKGDERALQAAAASVGPISVAVNAEPLLSYQGGVLDDPTCDKRALNHAILVVGYGTLNGKDYWLIKNSWGTKWGVAGYAMMSRNKDNQCGIASMAIYPLV